MLGIQAISIQLSTLANSLRMNADSMGLSPDQIDLMEVLIGVLHNIIDDGIQPNEIDKLCKLVGALKELVPEEFKAGLEKILKSLRNIQSQMNMNGQGNDEDDQSSNPLGGKINFQNILNTPLSGEGFGVSGVEPTLMGGNSGRRDPLALLETSSTKLPMKIHEQQIQVAEDLLKIVTDFLLENMTNVLGQNAAVAEIFDQHDAFDDGTDDVSDALSTLNKVTGASQSGLA